MNDRPDVPEEAVELAASDRWNRASFGSMISWDQAVREEHPQVPAERQRVRRALEAAAPALRKQGAEEAEQRLREGRSKSIGEERAERNGVPVKEQFLADWREATGEGKHGH